MSGIASFDEERIWKVNRKEVRVTNMPDNIDSDTKSVDDDSVQNSEDTSEPKRQHFLLESVVFPQTLSASASATGANLETAAEGSRHST